MAIYKSPLLSSPELWHSICSLNPSSPVVFDQRWLQSRLDTALGVWTGRAAPRPVDEDWKCSNCLFKPSCWQMLGHALAAAFLLSAEGYANSRACCTLFDKGSTDIQKLDALE
eukprot:338725-Pelagomonas_calceolata.AAC.2